MQAEGLLKKLPKYQEPLFLVLLFLLVQKFLLISGTAYKELRLKLQRVLLTSPEILSRPSQNKWNPLLSLYKKFITDRLWDSTACTPSTQFSWLEFYISSPDSRVHISSEKYICTRFHNSNLSSPDAGYPFGTRIPFVDTDLRNTKHGGKESCQHVYRCGWSGIQGIGA